jgi:hypothetical protein
MFRCLTESLRSTHIVTQCVTIFTLKSKLPDVCSLKSMRVFATHIIWAVIPIKNGNFCVDVRRWGTANDIRRYMHVIQALSVRILKVNTVMFSNKNDLFET